MEWAVEVLKTSGLPVCCNMSVTDSGDSAGNSVEECAVRMARSGAEVIGINCAVGPFESLKIMERMKSVLKQGNMERHLMIQPLGIHTPDAMGTQNGWIDLQEQPLGNEY